MQIKRKVLLFGSSGMLGREFLRALRARQSFRVLAPLHAGGDITDYKKIAALIKKVRPDIVINCAAMIHIEGCEKDQNAAWRVNAEGPGNIARALREAKLLRPVFLHVSTSDVFGGKKKCYREDDKPSPVNSYGRSKRGGEEAIQRELQDGTVQYFIIRTSWIYSEFRDTFADLVARAFEKGEDFFAVSDQYSIVTWARNVAEASLKLLAASGRYNAGIYHVVNKSDRPFSKYEIAREIARILKKNPRRLKKSYKKNVFVVRRPDSAYLVNTKFPALPEWRTALKKYLVQKYNGRKKKN